MIERIHDFRKDKCRWGWNGLSFKISEDKSYAIMSGIGKYIKKGHFIIIGHPEGDHKYYVKEIEYNRSPEDLFTAKLFLQGKLVPKESS